MVSQRQPGCCCCSRRQLLLIFEHGLKTQQRRSRFGAFKLLGHLNAPTRPTYARRPARAHASASRPQRLRRCHLRANSPEPQDARSDRRGSENLNGVPTGQSSSPSLLSQCGRPAVALASGLPREPGLPSWSLALTNRLCFPDASAAAHLQYARRPADPGSRGRRWGFR